MQIDFGDDPIHIIGSPCPPPGFVPVSGLSLSYFPIVTKYSASIGINLLFYYSCKKVPHSGERWTGAPLFVATIGGNLNKSWQLSEVTRRGGPGAVEFTNENGIGPFRVDGAPIRRWALGNLLWCLEKCVMAQVSYDFLSSRRHTVHPMKTCQLLGLND